MEKQILIVGRTEKAVRAYPNTWIAISQIESITELDEPSKACTYENGPTLCGVPHIVRVTEKAAQRAGWI